MKIEVLVKDTVTSGPSLKGKLLGFLKICNFEISLVFFKAVQYFLIKSLSLQQLQRQMLSQHKFNEGSES